MKPKKHPLMFAILAGLVVPVLFWIGGWDFNERGATAVVCVLISIYTGASTYALLNLKHEI